MLVVGGKFFEVMPLSKDVVGLHSLAAKIDGHKVQPLLALFTGLKVAAIIALLALRFVTLQDARSR